MQKAQEFADHWATQKDRADKYTALIQQGTVDKAMAEAYFIERIAPLPHQVNGIIGGAKTRALGAARKYSKMLKN